VAGSDHLTCAYSVFSNCVMSGLFLAETKYSKIYVAVYFKVHIHHEEDMQHCKHHQISCG
jgi:hypothetical protein